MKKLLLLLLFSAGINAQTLSSENFDALGSPIVLPSGWSISNLSSPIGTATWFRGNPTNFVANNGPTDGYIAVNYNSVAGAATINNWLFTPSVTVQNGDEVSFFTRTSSTGVYPDRLELRMSTAATPINPIGLAIGSYSTICLTVNPNLVSGVTGGYPVAWTKQTYVVSGLTGAVSSKFAFRYYVTNGGTGANSDNIGVDDFQIKRPVLHDLSLETVTVPAILSAGNFNFNGVVRNQGTNAVTSYNVTWKANGGAVNNFSVTGVNIAPNSTHNFTHSLPLNAVAGQNYALVFNVSTVNGLADNNTSDNTLNKSTQVANGSTAFTPLIEKFTGSTCGPCATYNNATFNPFYDATSASNTYNYIAYQMNWPGAGDPYYTAEGGVRRGFYGINSITSLWIDGVNYSTGNNQPSLTSHVTSEGAKTGYFALTANRNLSNNIALINYNITPYLSGNYVVYAAVIEKLTTNNTGTNGEISFKHVMMKMVPDASGTAITCVAGVPFSGQISASLAGTNIEEVSDLEVVVFIQNPTTKEIMQSFRALDALSVNTNTINQVKLYPNPAQDFIKISNIDIADIAITDISGKTVIMMKNITDSSDIKVSNLNSGIYFITVKNEKINQTIKFVKK